MTFDIQGSEPDYFDDFENDDFDGPDDMEEGHGFDCDCQDCTNDWHESECGQLPPDLGGGCQSAGSEYCEFECPFRNRVVRESL